MEPLVSSTSTLAAFLGGMLALSAPCCVTYLLPAYLASAFKAKRAVLAMTFVFALGIAAVLLPITLGVAAVSRLLGEFHTEVFLLGGLLLIFLGVWSLAGRNLALPFHVAPSGRYNVFSVFGLGVFSGAASSCCAPVLAGVLTLSALSSSLPQATLVGLAYVSGMVFPLMVLAYFWERFNLSGTALLRGRMVRLGPGKRGWELHSTNLIAGLLFVAMGTLILTLTLSGGAEASSGFQTSVNRSLTDIADRIMGTVATVPDYWFALLLLIVFAGLLLRAFPLPRLFLIGSRRKIAAWVVGQFARAKAYLKGKPVAAPEPAQQERRGGG